MFFVYRFGEISNKINFHYWLYLNRILNRNFRILKLLPLTLGLFPLEVGLEFFVLSRGLDVVLSDRRDFALEFLCFSLVHLGFNRRVIKCNDNLS